MSRFPSFVSPPLHWRRAMLLDLQLQVRYGSLAAHVPNKFHPRAPDFDRAWTAKRAAVTAEQAERLHEVLSGSFCLDLLGSWLLRASNGGMLNLAELQYFWPWNPWTQDIQAQLFARGWRLLVLPPRSQQQHPSYSSAEEWLCGRRRAHWWCPGQANSIVVLQRSTRRSPRWSRCSCAHVLWSCRSWRGSSMRPSRCLQSCLPTSWRLWSFKVCFEGDANHRGTLVCDMLWHSFPSVGHRGRFGRPKAAKTEGSCAVRNWNCAWFCAGGSIQFSSVPFSDAKILKRM